MSEASLDEKLSRKIQLRPDIEWSLFSVGVRSGWVARDPIALSYFHFSSLERSVAQLLDGSRSLKDILAMRHAEPISGDWLCRLVTRLDNASLTVPRSIRRTGHALWLAGSQQRRRRFWQRCLSPLAIRVKLFDPTSLLIRLGWLANILFSKTFATLWLIAGTLIGASVFFHWLNEPGSLVASFQNMTTERAIGLVVIYLVVKSLHELGHALACKKWGSECHEIGVFFLVFTPCLYCDTSDSWKLSSRWRRACIAAAGIYVELILAVVAGAVWLVTPPESVLHLLAANVMLVCSFSTLLVNGNPLLRYDGYYALSDLWSVPNLSEQSREAFRELSLGFMSKARSGLDRWDADVRCLALFAVSSWIYRHIVVFVVMWVIWQLLDGMGLGLVGILLVAFTLAGVLLTNFLAMFQWVTELFLSGGVHMLRIVSFGLTLVVGGLVFFQRPWPTYVTARGVTSYADMEPLFANQTGNLAEFTLSGQPVTAGCKVARLLAPNLELEVIDVRGEVQVLRQRSEQLNISSVDVESAATELATITEQLAKAELRLQILERELSSLVATASHGGILVSAPRMPYRELAGPADQPTEERLLTGRNQDSLVERGQLLAWLSRPDKYTLTAYVAEHDAELLRPGLKARCRWDCESSRIYEGTIVRIAPEPIAEIPGPLRGDESLAVRTDRDGRLLPELPHYAVDVSIPSQAPTATHHSLTTVHFETAPRTLYQSLRRLLDQHVRPEL